MPSSILIPFYIFFFFFFHMSQIEICLPCDAYAVNPFYSSSAAKYLTLPTNSISKILRLPHMERINKLNSWRNVIFDDGKNQKIPFQQKYFHTPPHTYIQVSTYDTLGPYAYGIKLVQRWPMKRQCQPCDNIAGDQLKILKLDFSLHEVTQKQRA